MDQIFKQALPTDTGKMAEDGSHIQVELEFPLGAKILSVHEQHGHIALWYRFGPSSGTEVRHLAVVPTGGKVPDWADEFIGTVFVEWTVWHVFAAPAELPF